MTKLEARLIAVTQPIVDDLSDAEELVGYCAKVSNPAGQDDMTNLDRLLSYCIKNKHFSILEMANAVVELQAPRDITRQLLRHRSFSFQEFSQRYSAQIEFTEREMRMQDTKNRQNSIMPDPNQKDMVYDWEAYIEGIKSDAYNCYKDMIARGVAKEVARVVLPEGLTMSRVYVNGTLRSWLHYLDVRDDEGVTQKEHVMLARKIKEVLLPAFPRVFGVVNELE